MECVSTLAALVPAALFEALGATEVSNALGAVAVTDAPRVTPLELLFVFLGGVVVYVTTRALRWGLPLLPLTRARRARLGRLGPIGETLLWVVYLASAIAWVLSGHPGLRLVALGLLAALLVWGWFASIRDYLVGVLVRSDGSIEVGDVVRSGEVEGRVAALGGRAVEIETAAGDRVLVPYSTLGGRPIVRRSRRQTASRHTFRVTVPAGLSLEEARVRVRRAVALCHWVPPSYEAHIVAASGPALEVTVHAFSEAQTAAVEASVRSALDPPGVGAGGQPSG